MKTKRLTLIPLSVLALGALTGCNKTSNLLTVALATGERVDTFNKVVANHQLDKSIDKNNNVGIYYSASKLDDYCAEQNFGFYIYNNIQYVMKYYYGNNQVKNGAVITGKTRQYPDKMLATIYNTVVPEEYRDTTLTAKVDINSKDGKTIVDFKADWDFRNDYFAKTSFYNVLNSVILTNGQITYDNSTKKTEKLMVNYYWTNNHRAFGSYTMDFKNNSFYFLDGGGASVNEDSRWEWQKGDIGGKDGTIHTIWNDGTLDCFNICNYTYTSFEAFTGNIADNLSSINMNGYIRDYPYEAGQGAVEPETNEFSLAWSHKVNECYKVNKDLKLRNEMIDTSSAVSVDMDKCPKYAEAKAKLYWIYTSTQEYTNTSVVPFIEYDNLKNVCNNLLKNDQITNDQKNLLNTVKNYLNSLNEKDYLGEFTTDDIIFKYIAPTDEKLKESYYLGCNRVYSFNYRFENKNGSVAVNFTLDSDGNPLISK